MSEAEKNAQIGIAVTEFQAAKVELAHQQERLKRVFGAYVEAGAAASGAYVRDEVLRFQDGVKFRLADLLNATELRDAVAQRQQAQAAYDEAKASMNRLGLDLS